ncbi:MAG: hypothetical protein ACI82H_001208 [Alphaproteobacteria bacterium]|jgi:hypothetical protein
MLVQAIDFYYYLNNTIAIHPLIGGGVDDRFMR